MPTFVSPGVYIREIDLSVYVPLLSSTIHGMVGTSQKGPINERVLITSPEQFTETFGDPNPNHLATYSALEFLREGNILWFVRVNGSTASKAQAQTVNGIATNAFLETLGKSSFTFTTAAVASHLGTEAGTFNIVASTSDKLVVKVNGGPAVTITLTAGATQSRADIAADIDAALDAFGATATDETTGVQISTDDTGAAASVEILDTDAVTTATLTLLGLTAGVYTGTDDTGSLRVTTVDTSTGAEVTAFADVDFISTDTTAALVRDRINTDASALDVTATVVGTNKVRITHDNAGSDYGLRVTSSQGALGAGAGPELGFTENQEAFGRGVSPAAETFKVFALNEGLWGNDLSIIISAGSAEDTFKITVLDDGAAVESWDDLVSTFDAKDTRTDGVYFVAERINDSSAYIAIEDVGTNTGYPINGTYLFSGGDDGLETVNNADYIGTISGNTRTGLQLFGDPDDVDVNLITCPGVSSAAVINAMVSLCESRGDCMAIIDPPYDLSIQQIVDWHNGTGGYDDHQSYNTNRAALYYSWLQVFDPVSEQNIYIPPSGPIAGVYAYTDRVGEQWFAPAGLNRGRLVEPLKVQYSPTQGEREFMYGNRNSVNPIVNFVRDGITVWGQRSLQRKPSDLDRVNVVRLILYMRKVLTTLYRTVLFEPNDPITWRQVVRITEPFLQTLQARRAITRFVVKCDETTNTPALIDQNKMRVIILIDPIEAAEQVEVDIVLTNTGADFNEVLSRVL